MGLHMQTQSKASPDSCNGRDTEKTQGLFFHGTI